ncbi:MAG: leucyl/phenylalanyl-tRNA--protein transferase [Nitrococcus mobilis]|nr:leucyl/phenylalanyl-tRNA--protein transferase [Nitrococcus mobilis]
MSHIPWIAPDDHTSPFPDVETALREPNGLVAIGGPLSPERLERAYRCGIFPWFSEDQPVLWWSPDPRLIIYPRNLRASRSLRKRLRQQGYRLTMDQCFQAVIEACSAPRRDQAGTWITPEIMAAYWELHQRGIAHSVEVWRAELLIGGLYGVSLGAAFFGESMFSRATDASKIALAWLAAQLDAWSFDFIDCQMPTPHLRALGGVEISRRRFIRELYAALAYPTRLGPWAFSAQLDPLMWIKRKTTEDKP